MRPVGNSDEDHLCVFLSWFLKVGWLGGEKRNDVWTVRGFRLIEPDPETDFSFLIQFLIALQDAYG